MKLPVFPSLDALFHPFSALVFPCRIVHVGDDYHHILDGLGEEVILRDGLVDGYQRYTLVL